MIVNRCGSEPVSHNIHVSSISGAVNSTLCKLQGDTFSTKVTCYTLEETYHDLDMDDNKAMINIFVQILFMLTAEWFSDV